MGLPLPKYKEPKLDMGRRKEFRSSKHRAFVRSLVCVAWKLDGDNCQPGPRQFCHVRHGTHFGLSQTPDDWWGYPACSHHHLGDQHQHGEPAFELKYGVHLKQMALQLADITARKDPVFRAALDEAKRREPHLFQV